jgi:hypothetical protein
MLCLTHLWYVGNIGNHLLIATFLRHGGGMNGVVDGFMVMLVVQQEER